MSTDIVDNLLIQWEEERPDLNAESLGVVVRIHHLAKALSDRAADALDAVGLSLWEYDVLSALRRQGRPFRLTASELAAENRLSTGAMTNRIDKLEARNLVTRAADADDRRSIQVELTEHGRELMSTALERRLDAAEDSLRRLDENDRVALATLLRKILVYEEAIS